MNPSLTRSCYLCECPREYSVAKLPCQGLLKGGVGKRRAGLRSIHFYSLMYKKSPFPLLLHKDNLRKTILGLDHVSKPLTGRIHGPQRRTSSLHGPERNVSDSETRDAVNLLLAVDNTAEGLGQHGGSAALVSIRGVDLVTHDLDDLLVSRGSGKRGALGRAENLHVRGGKQLPVLAEEGSVDGKVDRVGGCAVVNRGVDERVGGDNLDGAAAEGLEMVDERVVGGAPVKVSNADVALELVEDGLALDPVTGKNGSIDISGQRVGRVGGAGGGDDGLVVGGGLLEGELADVGGERADDGVCTLALSIVKSTLLGIVGGIGHKRTRVGGEVVCKGVRDGESGLILEILAYTGQVGDHLDAELVEELLGADARKLQDLGGVDAAGSKDDFLGGKDVGGRPAAGREILHADGLFAARIEKDLADNVASEDVVVRTGLLDPVMVVDLGVIPGHGIRIEY